MNIDPKRSPGRSALYTALTLGVLGWAPLALSQVDSDESEDEIFELSPFEVTGDQDQGYRATSTLAGTRIRTDLKDVGTAISVYTEQFLDDIGATDNNSLLQYTTNAEAGGTQGTYLGYDGGATVNEGSALVSPQTNNRIRGLASADNTRDYAVTDIPWDSYNTQRIDVLRGANSFLFGLGSPAGIVNATMAGASFDNEGEIGLRFGSYGSARANFSLNKTIIEDTLAVRFAALMDHQQFRQEQAFEDDERGYIAIRYEPKLFGDDASTALNFKYEDGNIDANRPRNVSPMDGLTPWWNPAEVDPVNNPFGGLGQLTVENPFEAAAGVGNSSSDEYNAWVGGAANQQQPFWLIDGASGQVYGARAGIINNGARNDDGSVRGAAEGIVGRRQTQPFIATRMINELASDLGLPRADSGLYKAQSLTDPTVFNFYDQLIDGNTKWEKNEWDAVNFDLQQSFFNNKLAFQIVYDKQDYMRSNENLLGWQPTLRIDVLENWDDFSVNPNVGRAYVQTSMGGSGSSVRTEREYKRGSVFAELDASDFMDSDSFITRLLGKHRFNGVVSEQGYATEDKGWNRVAAGVDWYDYWTGANGLEYPITERPPQGIIYLGDSLIGASSASGINLPAVGAADVQIAGNSVTVFDSSWNAPSSVAFDAPWTIPANIAGAYDFGEDDEGNPVQPLQNSNPANYRGWIDRPVDLLYYTGAEDDYLLARREKKNSDVESAAMNIQSFWWDGALITTLGWREDEVTSGRTAYGKDTTDRYRVVVPQKDDDLSEKSTSRSRGAVLHVNQLFGQNDPIPFNVSLSYNEGSNFQPTAVRRDLYGRQIANPSGETEDIGISLSTKDGKYTFRALKYESLIYGNSASLPTGNIGGFIANGLSWRNVFLYELGAYAWSDRGQVSYRNQASTAFPADATIDQPWYIEEGSELESQVEDMIVSEWNAIQGWLDERGFFEAWKMNVVPMENLPPDRSTYEASLDDSTPPNPAPQWVPPAGTVSAYGFSTPDNFAVTSDVLSEGYEFEFIANPTENWRIAFNASKTEASNSNVGGELIQEFVDYMDTAVLNTAAGNTPRWGNWGGGRIQNIYSNFRSEYVLLKLQEGTAVPELRKWRYNVVTNYSFSDGKFKGLSLGGSYRWQDKVAISYPLQGDTPAEYTFDLNNPIFAPSEDGIDLWASYERELTDRIDWRIQLNVRNVGKGDELIPVSYNPNGSIAGLRVGPTQEWFITNTFSF
ncbi:TonB-dependent receptor plug domain-containing protein [Pelagicoccus sp. SDUM812003]|uniref:TonB-dependent receptor plug domain-containing protein n=1 Tax=Pelagicoccus sp. SDUM812003 TaxID=3041267 RepID=UPI00281242CF|nr:TonB-dependent receptor plug domain-containing protein [Pelagicoccus sp. SDUM812003]